MPLISFILSYILPTRAHNSPFSYIIVWVSLPNSEPEHQNANARLILHYPKRQSNPAHPAARPPCLTPPAQVAVCTEGKKPPM